MQTREWIWVGGVCAAVVGVFVLAGTILGFLGSKSVPAIDLSQMPIVALKTLMNMNDPAMAWPREYRPYLPGPLAFYVTWAILALDLWLAFILFPKRAEWAMLKEFMGSGREDAETARWAKTRDLKKLFVKSATRGRLILGRFNGQLVAAEERQSVLITAPSQSGKTSGLVVPAILDWDGPIIATSVKGDLLEDTHRARLRRGKVFVFDPTGSTDFEHSQATPLSSCTSWTQARKVAHWFAEAARPSASEELTFWYQQAEKLLAPVLLAAAKAELTMEDVVRILDEGPAAGPEVVEALGDEDCAVRQWEAIQRREAKQLSSIYATTELVVGCFADPEVAERCQVSEFSAADLLDGPNTLYLIAPVHEQGRLAPLFAMLIQDIIRVVYAEATAKRGGVGKGGIGAALDPPLLLALDELANIAPIPDLDKVASTGAAQGIQLLSVVQDFAQLKKRFGALEAQTIINNHRAVVLGTGQKDTDTLEFVQRVSGATELAQRSETVGTGRDTRTEGSTFRDIAPANVVREQHQEEALLIYGSLPPAKLKLRPWFKDRQLTRQVEATDA